MAKEYNVLSWENRHLTQQSIESYNSGKLSEMDMHKAERHILNCDLCAEALEGYGQKPGSPKVRQNLETLRHQIRQKSEGKKSSGSIFRTLGIAASILIILGVGLYYIQSSFLSTSDEPQVAMKQEPPPTTPQNLSIDNNLEPIEEELTVDEDLPNETSEVVQTEVPVSTPLEPIRERASDPKSDEALASSTELLDETDHRDAGLASEEETFEMQSDDPGDVQEEQTDMVPMTEEHLEEAKKVATELAKTSSVGGGPELATSTRLTSGAKLGGSIMDSDPEPEIGFEEYGTYLKNDLQYPEEARLNNISGVVKIGFILKPGSSYSKFRIIEGLGYGCNEEAERLIKEGPNWKPAVRKGLVTKEEVIVEVRFE